jgi:hypothetical protein
MRTRLEQTEIVGRTIESVYEDSNDDNLILLLSGGAYIAFNGGYGDGGKNSVQEEVYGLNDVTEPLVRAGLFTQAELDDQRERERVRNAGYEAATREREVRELARLQAKYAPPTARDGQS